MFSQDQNLRLDVKRVFNMENLPVRFASLDDDGTTDLPMPSGPESIIP